MDRSLYVPVRCDEAQTAYSGRWYWEPVKSIIEVNGSEVDRKFRFNGRMFHPGDRVVIKFKSRTYRGTVVNPETPEGASSTKQVEKEEELMASLRQQNACLEEHIRFLTQVRSPQTQQENVATFSMGCRLCQKC